MTTTPKAAEVCGDRTVFWPDDEAIDVACVLPDGHDGDHEDDTGSEWENEDYDLFDLKPVPVPPWQETQRIEPVPGIVYIVEERERTDHGPGWRERQTRIEVDAAVIDPPVDIGGTNNAIWFAGVAIEPPAGGDGTDRGTHG